VELGAKFLIGLFFLSRAAGQLYLLPRLVRRDLRPAR